MQYETLQIVLTISAITNIALFILAAWYWQKIQFLEDVIAAHNHLFEQMGFDWDTGRLDRQQFFRFTETLMTTASKHNVHDSDISGQE